MYFPALAKKTINAHSPIHLASRNGHYDIVKALIDKGMSANLEVTLFSPFFGLSNSFFILFLIDFSREKCHDNVTAASLHFPLSLKMVHLYTSLLFMEKVTLSNFFCNLVRI